MTHVSVWLDCSTPGCDRGGVADSHHLANLSGRDFYCPMHATTSRGGADDAA